MSVEATVNFYTNKIYVFAFVYSIYEQQVGAQTFNT